jgi:putative transposase
VARRLRSIAPDSVVHVVNRGNERRRLFDRPRDYDDFLWISDHATGRIGIRLLGYVLMPNHWHLVLWPHDVAELSQFLHLLTTSHAARFRYASATTGLGHVYQGRYRAAVVDGDIRYIRTLRYVEANPVRANLVRRAEDWPWSSFRERLSVAQRIVDGPIALPCPEDWARLVNDEAVVDVRSCAGG